VNYARLSDNYSVAPQIQPEDVAYFASEGFTTIICNRPDGEDVGQPPSAAIRDACTEHDVEFHMIPMQGRGLDTETVGQFITVMRNASGPVLGYCRRGTRSAILSQVASQAPPEPTSK
jgi:sulfide:quinone oxidoreductase